MPLDPEIALQYNPNPNLGPNWNQIYQSQNQAYRNYLQQQDIAGTNALRDAFAGGNALDPNTGLPRPEIMSRVYQTDPNKALAMTEVLTKLRDEQSRTMYNNLQYAEKVGGSYRDNVMEPSIKMYQDLQSRGLPQEQIQNLTEENKRKLFTEWKNSNGIPDATADRLDHPFFDLNNGQGTSWPFRSTAFQKRADAVTKEWSRAKQFVDKTGNTFVFNPYYGAGAFDAVTHQPITPVGPYHEVGTKGEAPEKPLPQGEAATVNGRPTTVYRFPDRIEEASKPGSSLDPNTVEILPKKAGGGAASQPKEEMIRVKGPDNKERDVPVVRQPIEPGKPIEYINQKTGERVDPATIIQTDVKGSSIETPESEEGEKRQIKAIASYQQAPYTGYAARSPEARRIMDQVMLENPDYQATRYPEIAKAMRDFGTGKQGDITRSLNVGIDHLASLTDLISALGSNSEPAIIRRLGQAVQTQLGLSAAPTTFDAAKEIVGSELIKAVQGAQGALGDREDVRKTMNRSLDPTILNSVVAEYKRLMAGQLRGLETQYEDATGFGSDNQFSYRKKLRPETIKELDMLTQSPGGSVSVGSGASSTGSSAPPFNVPTLLDQIAKDPEYKAGDKININRDPGGKGPVMGQIVKQRDGTTIWVPK